MKSANKMFFLLICLFTLGLFLAFATVGKGKLLLTLFFGAAYVFLVTVAFLIGRKFELFPEPILFIIPVFLSGLGLTELYALQMKQTNGIYEDVAFRQMAWLAASMITVLAVSALTRKHNYEKLARYKYIWAILGMVLLGLTIPFGQSFGGARSWLSFGSLTIQPSEFVKILIVLFLAGYLSEYGQYLKNAHPKWWIRPFKALWYLGPLLFVWIMALLLLVFQRDLGTAVLYFGVFLALIYLVSGRFSYVVAGGLVAAVGAVISLAAFDHVRMRVKIWLNPWNDITGAGYQIVQSLFALGSGGILGVGFGAGQPEIIPSVHNDFIIAAIAEELGLMGGLLVLAMFLALCARGLYVAKKTGTVFGFLLASGLSLLLAWQVIVIVGGVVRLLPLTGVNLPFISYGGSSLVSSYATIGLLQGMAGGNNYHDG